MEGISFLVALRTVTLNATQRGMKVFDYVWYGKDPTPIAVLLEDSGAVIGIAIAGRVGAPMISSNQQPKGMLCYKSETMVEYFLLLAAPISQ